MKSMTASAHTRHSFHWGQVNWEIRSVNQRYLELNIRLPDALRALEMPLRDACKTALHRGKLDISLRYDLNESNHAITINTAQLAQLNHAINQIQQTLPEATQVNPIDLLNWPGLVENTQIQLSDYQDELLTSFNDALAQLNHARQREGEHIQSLLSQRTQAMRQQLQNLSPILPEILANQTAKLRERIAELTDHVDEARLAMEIAMMAQKADIAEEIDRLHNHLNEVERVINQQGAVGRRLDFLMQELNREANTLGSKSIDLRTTQTSVELKVLIEQMREQVQNIE